MDDYISREADFDAFNKLDYDICTNETFDNLRGYYGFSEETVNQTINSIPSADVRPIVRGKWILKETVHFGLKEYTCSNCQDDEYWEKYYCRGNESFCPNCGAMMMEE